MRSESVCVSLENGRATATMTIRMPMLSTIAGQAILQKRAIFEMIKDSPFLQKKNSCKCRSWMVGGGARS